VGVGVAVGVPLPGEAAGVTTTPPPAPPVTAAWVAAGPPDPAVTGAVLLPLLAGPLPPVPVLLPPVLDAPPTTVSLLTDAPVPPDPSVDGPGVGTVTVPFGGKLAVRLCGPPTAPLFAEVVSLPLDGVARPAPVLSAPVPVVPPLPVVP